MATYPAAGFSIPSPAPQTVEAPMQRSRRRQISPEAGHALEKLGHAIEYLTDEFVHFGASLSADDARLEAIQLLMARNREVYFECPELPRFSERFRALLHLKHA